VAEVYKSGAAKNVQELMTNSRTPTESSPDCSNQTTQPSTEHAVGAAMFQWIPKILATQLCPRTRAGIIAVIQVGTLCTGLMCF
jgi:hypothetical protein